MNLPFRTVLLRCLLTRIPKRFIRLLWLIVGIKLLLPVTILNPVQLLPNVVYETADRVDNYILGATVPVITQPENHSHSGTEAQPPENQTYGHKEQQELSEKKNPDATYEAQPERTYQKTLWSELWSKAFAFVNPANSFSYAGKRMEILSLCWVLGMVLFWSYLVICYLYLKHLTRMAIKLQANIWQMDAATPFVLGLIHPRIYIPYSLCEEDMEYVLAHERSHIRHGDPVFKLLGFLLLGYYWMHPLVWIAYLMFGKDLEYACDERVISQMSRAERKAYSQSLLACSVEPQLCVYPLAFAEGDIMSRIKNILNYKKPSFYAVIGTVVLCVILGIAFLTTPANKHEVNADVNTQRGLTANTRQYVYTFTDAREFVTNWVAAFTERNIEPLLEYSTKEVQDEWVDQYLTDEEFAHFGYSSPWPIDSDSYQIVSCDDSEAVIYYYAVDSEPHSYVWKEVLAIENGADGYKVTKDTLTMFTDISSAEQFADAYPDSSFPEALKYGTEWKDTLYSHYTEDAEAYDGFAKYGRPDSAAIFFLNLDENSVNVADSSISEDGESAMVVIAFGNDADKIVLQMNAYRKAGSEEAIWIPVSWARE